MKIISRHKRIFFTIIMFLLIIILSIPAYAIYANTRNLIEEEIGKSTMAISVSVAEIIAQDIESYKRLSAASSYVDGSYDKAYYEKMQHIFRTLKDTTEVRYIYTEKKVTEDTTMYILDGEPMDSEFFSPLGSTDQIDQYKILAYETKKPNFSPMENYPVWGDLISGYAPIIDPLSGQVIGLVGTDVSANQLNNIISYLRTIIFFSFTVILLILSYAVYKLIWITTDSLDTDYLTGLSTKSHFENALRRNILKSKKSKIVFSVMMIDIDHFKAINDTFGHHFGDQVLKDVSNELRKNTRGFDICARYGGDEFICLLPTASINVAEMIATRILTRVSELIIDPEMLPKPIITLSIGIYEYDQVSSYDLVIKSADEALYRSKNTGKNKVTSYK